MGGVREQTASAATAEGSTLHHTRHQMPWFSLMTWKWLQFSLFVHIFVAQASAYLRCNLNLLLGSSINCQLEREQGSAGTRTALNPRVTRRLGVGHAVGGRYVARGRRRIPGALCMVELYRNDAEVSWYL